MSNFIYDEDYTGPRWTYATLLRPPARFSIPDEGWIVGSKKDHPKYRHGTIDYIRQLTEDELCHYDMVLIIQEQSQNV